MENKEEYKNYKCLLCGKLYGNNASLTSHMRQKHGQGMRFGANWNKVAGGTPPKPKKSKSVSKIITPQTSYVDIPVVLRVPIVLGEAKIVNVKGGYEYEEN